jgi:hypothetical protein
MSGNMQKSDRGTAIPTATDEKNSLNYTTEKENNTMDMDMIVEFLRNHIQQLEDVKTACAEQQKDIREMITQIRMCEVDEE